jgi:hypothetical protein
MIPIYTRILSSAHYFLNKESEIIKFLDVDNILKSGDSEWTQDTNANYQWVHDVWFWLNKEFWYRYDDIHDDWNKLYNKLSHVPENIKEGSITTPPKCDYKQVESLEDELQNSIETYRGFYREYCRNANAKWGGIVENMRQPPSWI